MCWSLGSCTLSLCPLELWLLQVSKVDGSERNLPVCALSRAQRRNEPLPAAPVGCRFTPRAVCSNRLRDNMGNSALSSRLKSTQARDPLKWCSLSSSSVTGKLPPCLPFHLAIFLPMSKWSQRATREKNGCGFPQQHGQDKLFLLLMAALQRE